MTSKISFFSLCIENLKRRIWLLVLSVLTFFISMPLTLMVVLQNETSYRSEIAEWRILEIFSNFFGIGFNSVLAPGFAIICAIGGFAWLFSKKKVDLYHSVPVKREKLFAVCYVNGILLFFVPYLVSCIVCLVIISPYLSITSSLISMAVVTFFVHLLFFLLFYNLMLVALMLTGNMINCLLTGGVLFFYAIAARGLLEAYLSSFIRTYYNQMDFLYEMRFGSPLMSYLYFLESFVTNRDYVITYITGGAFALYLLQCFVFMVLVGVLALFLYKKRPSEAAGKSIAFSQILNIYRILLVIPLSLGSGLFFAALVSADTMSVATAWMCFGLLFGLILSHGFIEVLFQMDIRAMFSYKKQLLATGVIVFLLAFSVKGDWYGIGKSMPKQEDVGTVAIYISGLNEGNISEREMEGNRLVYSSSNYVFENMELTMPEAYQLIKKGVQGIYEENYNGKNRMYIIAKFNLKNGKEVYKRGWMETEKAYADIETIYNSQEYKRTLLEKLKGGEIDSLSVSDATYSSIEIEKEWISEFIEIYCKEYEALSFDNAVRNGVIASFSFTSIMENGNYCRGNQIPVYQDFEETIAFLDKIDTENKLMLFDLKEGNISKIRINIYDREVYQEIGGTEWEEEEYEYNVTIQDPGEIKKLAPYLMADRYSGPMEGLFCVNGIRIEVFGINADKEEYVVSAGIKNEAPWKEIIKEYINP